MVIKIIKCGQPAAVCACLDIRFAFWMIHCRGNGATIIWSTYIFLMGKSAWTACTAHTFLLPLKNQQQRWHKQRHKTTIYLLGHMKSEWKAPWCYHTTLIDLKKKIFFIKTLGLSVAHTRCIKPSSPQGVALTGVTLTGVHMVEWGTKASRWMEVTAMRNDKAEQRCPKFGGGKNTKIDCYWIQKKGGEAERGGEKRRRIGLDVK